MITRNASGEHGVVLIALLWILTALSVIALSFSRETVVEISSARNARDLTVAYYAARAGIAAAAYQVMQYRLQPRVQQLELPGPPDPVEIGLLTGKVGEAEYQVEIQDESGKINLNQASEELLRGLINAVGIAKPEADVILDSILDWRDVDLLHHPNGAEDDYYQSLNPPYKAKNGRFDTVEELLLVRGVTRDIFYGMTERNPGGGILHKYGLSRYLTVYSITNRINVNYALPEVLMAMPTMTPQAAQQIYERRKTKPFASIEEITRTVPMGIGPTSMPYLSTDQTGVYTFTASGRRDNSRVVRVIKTVITLDPRESSGYKVVYWNENALR
jgi:general secretion pathway protein K